MSEPLRYEYADGDLLADRNTYFYSQYHGPEFLTAWQLQRQTAITQLIPRVSDHTMDQLTATERLLLKIEKGLDDYDKIQSALKQLDKLVWRFEVTKRIHDAYCDNWRARNVQQFRTPQSYVTFAELLARSYQKTKKLPYLNALLKITDTLTSQALQFDDALSTRIRNVLDVERALVNAASAHEVNSAANGREVHLRLTSGKSQDREQSFALLCCDSARSRAYIQALLRAGLKPTRVLFLGDERVADAKDIESAKEFCGIALPNVDEPVALTCKKNGLPLTRILENSVNAQAVRDHLGGLDCDIVVYSGFGGEIVSEETLSSGPRFLHMHSGWLPDYRGSTTLYYALLNGAPLGVSAIFLNAGIDTGPILARKQYPWPETGMNLDLVYDSAIRADLLCCVLQSMKNDTAGKCEDAQNIEDGTVYYVIHPVLKHLALLSLERDTHE